MSQSLTEASALGQATILYQDDFMKTTHTEWIVYSNCALALGWALILTILLSRMNFDSSKVKSQYGHGQ